MMSNGTREMRPPSRSRVELVVSLGDELLAGVSYDAPH
jgi:hypothetical protein